MDKLIEEILKVLDKKGKVTPAEIQYELKEDVVMIQIHRALKKLTTDKIVEVEEVENNKFFFLKQENKAKSTSVNVDKGGRDVTKYKFNGQEYGKSRLALAIISTYVKKNKPNYKQLCEVFPMDLTPPYGFIKPKEEAIEISKHRARFFIKEHEVLELSDGHVCVSNQFTKDRVERLIGIAQEDLGYEIE